MSIVEATARSDMCGCKYCEAMRRQYVKELHQGV